MLSIILIIVVILALGFDFINGFHDTANSIATSVSTRVLSPRRAILMAASLNFLGAFFSQEVARTISSVVKSESIHEYVVVAALLAAIIWNLITWYFGIPSSSSHALVGGLVGASVMYASSFGVIDPKKLFDKVILPLLTSPVIGIILGFIVMKLLYFILRNVSSRSVNTVFSKLQIVSAGFMSFTHGMNDAQKSMGIITLALVNSGYMAMPETGKLQVPIWVIIMCAVAMALGTSVGGWRIIKTMGVNMIKLQPVNGFAAETSAAIIIGGAALTGQSVSTTHIISTSIMGVGASKRLSAVRWALAKTIVWAWVLTIPVTAIMGAIITLAIKAIV